MDIRCALRHEPLVVACLRGWARALEGYERLHTGTIVAQVSEIVYKAVMTKTSLAMTAASTKSEVMASVQEDWQQDSRGAASISFEAFKDAIFQVADQWCGPLPPHSHTHGLHRHTHTRTGCIAALTHARVCSPTELTGCLALPSIRYM